MLGGIPIWKQKYVFNPSQMVAKCWRCTLCCFKKQALQRRSVFTTQHITHQVTKSMFIYVQIYTHERTDKEHTSCRVTSSSVWEYVKQYEVVSSVREAHKHELLYASTENQARGNAEGHADAAPRGTRMSHARPHGRSQGTLYGRPQGRLENCLGIVRHLNVQWGRDCKSQQPALTL